MAVLKFPPIDTADENGLLALGGDLELTTLLLAYRSGVFPWPISDEFPLAWFSPDPRGVINFSDLKVNKRLKRSLKNSGLTLTFNKDFDAVIEACGEVPRNKQSGTWITSPIIYSYQRLFDDRRAYSVEAWDGESLVGGIYGVCIDGIISGESMFHFKSNASKLCLVALLYLLNEADITWLDTQMVTPVVGSLGGKDIPRSDFLTRLKESPLRSRDEIFPEQLNLDFLNSF